MKRMVLMITGGYLGLAIVGHAKERRGTLTCECTGECWCKKQPRSLFRWVFPFRHDLAR